MRDWAKEYKRAGFAKRRKLVHDFVEAFGEQIYRNEGNIPEVTATFRIYDNIAASMAASGEQIKEYALDAKWLRYAMAQIVPTGSCVNCFENLGWDANEALHPRSSTTTTIETITIIGVSVRLLLEPTTKYPVGSKWESRGSGKIWEKVDEPVKNNELPFVRDDASKKGVYYFALYIAGGLIRRKDLER